MHWVNQCIGNEYHSSDIIQSVTQSQHAVRINPETWKNATQQLPGALNPHVRQATCTVFSHLWSSSLWRSDMMRRRRRKRAFIKQISEDNVKNRGKENSKSRFKSPQGAIETDCAFPTGATSFTFNLDEKEVTCSRIPLTCWQRTNYLDYVKTNLWK